MKILPAIALAAVFSLFVSSCCDHAQARYWKVPVPGAKGNAPVYAVDTSEVPLHKLPAGGVVFLDGAGHLAHPAKLGKPKQITEAEWRKATAGADYSLYYCGHCQGCWAKIRPRR